MKGKGVGNKAAVFSTDVKVTQILEASSWGNQWGT